MLAAAGIDLSEESPVCLSEQEKPAVDMVTERCVAEMDRLLACSGEEEK